MNSFHACRSRWKTNNKFRLFSFFFFLLLCFSQIHFLPAQPATKVASLPELAQAVTNAQPGTVIQLKNGNYQTEPVHLIGKGSAEKPVIIKAENEHQVILRSAIVLQGEYLSLNGIKFEEEGSITIEGNGCRIIRCLVSDAKSANWVIVRPGSYQAEIAYNTFENKSNNLEGGRNFQLMRLIVLNDNEQHHVHHNLFSDVPPGGGNGYETIQLITKGNPYDPPPGDCNTLIENNLFLRCNGEAEIISVKSNGNVLRNNTFKASRGSLVLRHGDDNLVEANLFLGAGESGTGGVRMQGTGQVVKNNYFQDLTDFGVAMMDGTSDNLYIRVENANILFNSFINCTTDLKIGLNHSKHPNGTVPKNCEIAGNLFYHGQAGTEDQQVLELVQDDQPESWRWSDNFTNINSVDQIGIKKAELHLNQTASGLMIPTAKTAKVLSHPGVVKDLSKHDRTSKTTVGALQFPVGEFYPLSDSRVGATLKP